MKDVVAPDVDPSSLPSDAGWLARLAQLSTDRSPDAVFWIAASGRICYVNDAACAVLGFSRDELLRRTVAEIDPNFPDEASWQRHWDDLRVRRSFTIESDHQTRDGRVLDTEVTVNYVEYEGREYNCAIMRDITERKQAEARLRRQVEELQLLNSLTSTLATSRDAEEMYETALDGLEQVLELRRLAILVREGDGVGRFAAWRGLSETYRTAAQGYTFWAPDTSDPQPVAISDVLTETGPVAVALADVVRAEGIRSMLAVPLSVKQRVIGKVMLYDSRARDWSAETVALVRSVAGQIAFAVDRQRGDAELWQSTALLRGIADATDDAVFLKGPQGQYIWCNRAAAHNLGIEPQDMVGRDDFALFPHDQAREIAGAHRMVYEQRQPATFTKPLVVAGGRPRMFQTSVGPVEDEQGNLIGTYGISRDVTTQHETDERVRQSEARHRMLVEHSNDAITVIAHDGSVVYQSPTFARLYGHDESATLGMPVFGFVHPEDLPAVVEGFSTAMRNPGVPVTAQYRFRHADGSYVLTEAIGVNRLDDPNVQGIVVNSRDVGERRRLEEQLRHAQKMEAIGRLAGGVAHDFNNLLTVINANSSEVLNHHPLEPEVREIVDEIRAAGDRAARLTRQLLAFASRQAFEPQVVDMNQVIFSLTGMLRRVIGEDVRLQVELCQGPTPVRVDPGELEQVVMNLSINARDAMPSGGTLWIRTQVQEEPPRVQLIVRDGGCGMDEETRSRMFEPFFTTKGPGRGTGLGLATVYGIVTHSGAEIAVDSAPGDGTALTLSFPRANEAVPVIVAERHPAPAAPHAATVLLVEDEGMVRTLTRRMLTGRGYRVLEAATGEEALQLYGRGDEPIDLLLTDVVMPGMNGCALALQMVAARPDLKVICMSGYTEEPERHAALPPGTRFVQKPFDPEELQRTIREALDGPQDSRYLDR